MSVYGEPCKLIFIQIEDSINCRCNTKFMPRCFQMRRSYFLDLGIVSGFAAGTLGLLGFRSRKCDWLPNRNYISGKGNRLNLFRVRILNESYAIVSFQVTYL